MKQSVNLSKLVIPHDWDVIDSQQLLDDLRWISKSDIQELFDLEDKKVQELETQLRVNKIIKSFKKSHVKIEENAEYEWIKWTNVYAKIRWTPYNYFISDDNWDRSNDNFQNLVEENAYQYYEIQKLMASTVKVLMSYWVKKEQIFPWSPFVESLKDALKLKDYYRLGDGSGTYDLFYLFNCAKWGFSVTYKHEPGDNKKLLLKIKE